MSAAGLQSAAELNAWVDRLFSVRELTGMGHMQRVEDSNLGLGWLYYGLARTIRPRRAVVIGSLRGFVPLVLGRALQDNLEGGEVTFIDPSLVDDFWTDPDAVRRHFESFDVNNVRHHWMTTQEFVQSSTYHEIQDIGLLYVDGLHTYEQAKFDFESFADRLVPKGIALFHDSIRVRSSGIYGEDKRYDHTVVHYMDELRANPNYQVLDLMFSDGLTLVRRTNPAPPTRND